MGVLRGFDQFMNLVLDGTVDTKTKADIGMVVSCGVCHLHHCPYDACLGLLFDMPRHAHHLFRFHGQVLRFIHVLWYHAQVVRGNSIVAIEALDGA